MLNEVVCACTTLAYIGNQLTNNIKLVETWEYKGFIVLTMDKLLDNVKSTILHQNVLPKVRCRVSVGVGRVTLATIVTSTV